MLNNFNYYRNLATSLVYNSLSQPRSHLDADLNDFFIKNVCLNIKSFNTTKTFFFFNSIYNYLIEVNGDKIIRLSATKS